MANDNLEDSYNSEFLKFVQENIEHNTGGAGSVHDDKKVALPIPKNLKYKSCYQSVLDKEDMLKKLDNHNR